MNRVMIFGTFDGVHDGHRHLFAEDIFPSVCLRNVSSSSHTNRRLQKSLWGMKSLALTTSF
ncbi:hypothetical protein HYV72_01095 [Candidatus Uhrbacteria bacterium]|nr:hypothetical protein [Candidatus Uhrbacteria bacterium]